MQLQKSPRWYQNPNSTVRHNDAGDVGDVDANGGKRLYCVVVQQPYCPPGHDVRYMAGKFDLSDFKPGGREDPVR